MAAPRSSQTFCARPGCGLAKSGHGFMPDACSKGANVKETLAIIGTTAARKSLSRKILGSLCNDITAEQRKALDAYAVRHLPESQRLYRDTVSAAGVRSFLRIK